MEKGDLKWIILLALVCLVVFANSLSGDFVYDDIGYIVRNTLIQDPSLIWKALTSDVLAFNGGGSEAVSNNWRPAFTLWNIIIYQLFGLNTAGWHIVSLLLHSGVCVLAFALLRRWGFSSVVAFSITLLFAVHPVHVESVAWISASVDPLFSLSLLGSLWFATNYRESRKNRDLFLLALFYLIALGSKEIGIICQPIYYFLLNDGTEQKKRANGSFSVLITLCLITVGYLLLRWSVLGMPVSGSSDRTSLFSSLLTLPAMFAFYLGKIFAPVTLAVNYPLMPITEISVANFIIPLAVSCAAIGGIIYLVLARPKTRLAAAIFLFPLIPVMNASLFDPFQIVHDRYLYLPILGAIMLLVSIAAEFVNERSVLIASCVIACVLALQTFRCNTVWANSVALWSHASAIDGSYFTSMQLGHALAEAERYDEAVQAWSAAIEKKPVVRGYLGRARALIGKKQYESAEKDLLTALVTPDKDRELYARYQIYEALGLVYIGENRLEDAVGNYRVARGELPMYAAALTGKEAAALSALNQKADALRELENVRSQARVELLPESKTVFLLLGMLYIDLGRKSDAVAALNEYLTQTASIQVKATLDGRNRAASLLETLR